MPLSAANIEEIGERTLSFVETMCIKTRPLDNIAILP